MSVFENDKDRKSTPLFDGLFKYFPDALAAVARVSQKGNDKHNPGEPLHWARGKSTDQRGSLLRHLLDEATGVDFDEDGELAIVHAAWRALAAAQIKIEEYRDMFDELGENTDEAGAPPDYMLPPWGGDLVAMTEVKS